ncbi:hypothetical protein K504DRAFT_459796 [Pleomassaria siparia CBS 279.74]|uniref:Uncharacterized protein n=1 Tax=Pleomassaria siparia CBS 279.74 TaxID=1314801 RepID=A0A6G1K1K9_9PLEO|nr:hypothetical protein K504DRAFT_459796 [Pleomassaria siparia CBS 279.74]
MDPVRVSLRVFAFAAFIGLVYCRGLSALSHVLTFLCGLLFPRVGIAIFSRVKRGTKAEDGSVSSIYGLDHGRLHLKIPPTLWMNMGYWYGAAEELVDV